MLRSCRYVNNMVQSSCDRQGTTSAPHPFLFLALSFLIPLLSFLSRLLRLISSVRFFLLVKLQRYMYRPSMSVLYQDWSTNPEKKNEKNRENSRQLRNIKKYGNLRTVSKISCLQRCYQSLETMFGKNITESVFLFVHISFFDMYITSRSFSNILISRSQGFISR